MSSSNFRIVQVSTYYDAAPDLVQVRIKYLRLTAPYKTHTVQISVSAASIAMWSEDDVIHMLAEKAAVYANESDLFYAILDWHKVQKQNKALEGLGFYDKYSEVPAFPKSGKPNDHKQHVHFAFDDIDAMKKDFIKKANHAAEIKGDLQEYETPGPKMEDIDALPGLMEWVTHPVTKKSALLKQIIINLNDEYEWTREQVADWLDTLDVDLRFQSPDVRIKEAKKNDLKSSITKLTAKIALAEAGLKKMKAELEETESLLKDLEASL